MFKKLLLALALVTGFALVFYYTQYLPAQRAATNARLLLAQDRFKYAYWDLKRMAVSGTSATDICFPNTRTTREQFDLVIDRGIEVMRAGHKAAEANRSMRVHNEIVGLYVSNTLLIGVLLDIYGKLLENPGQSYCFSDVDVIQA